MPIDEIPYIQIGATFTWERGNPHAHEEIEVTDIRINRDGEVWIQAKGNRAGLCWNELGRFLEAIGWVSVVAD